MIKLIADRKMEKALTAAKAKYPAIPEQTLCGFLEYYILKIPMESFGTACLTNNLMETYLRADEQNLSALKEIIMFLHWDFPAYCFGSVKKVNKYLNR